MDCVRVTATVGERVLLCDVVAEGTVDTLTVAVVVSLSMLLLRSAESVMDDAFREIVGDSVAVNSNVGVEVLEDVTVAESEAVKSGETERVELNEAVTSSPE